MTHKLCQNANFENEGTTILIGAMHVLLNILSNLKCLGYIANLAISRCKRLVMSFYFLKKINKMQVARLNFWLVYIFSLFFDVCFEIENLLVRCWVLFSSSLIYQIHMVLILELSIVVFLSLLFFWLHIKTLNDFFSFTFRYEKYIFDVWNASEWHFPDWDSNCHINI